MSDKLQAVRGMNDVLPPDIAKWHFVERRSRTLFESFGYREIRTPLLEYTPLFVRGIGEATDIVEKEMYTFKDRDEKLLTLRPEGTASCVRAYVEHTQHAQEPVTRWYYAGPMFRHERAQKGRYRQFYQMGCEVYGVAEPSLDAEMIAMVVALLRSLGIEGVDVRVNFLGTAEDRAQYREIVKTYFSGHVAMLCEDCRRRLESNPLRILDCKRETCAAVAAAAPATTSALSESSRASWAAVQDNLQLLEVPFTHDSRLVRGLDYYTGTVFEVRGTSSELGAQNALCGGGRYDMLVEELGGPKGTPAVGFAFGVERMVMAIPGAAETFDPGIDLFVVTHGEEAKRWALPAVQKMRLDGRRVEISHRGGSFKSQMKRADKLAARFVLIVGEEELGQKSVKLRDMKSGEERLVAQSELSSELERLL